ncbi:unnamed protein product [Ectocarpus sp. CCAP 1310/34]|nr:unnamed protein product [Ectocarpus sp. CCAP 1310/34]
MLPVHGSISVGMIISSSTKHAAETTLLGENTTWDSLHPLPASKYPATRTVLRCAAFSPTPNNAHS